MCIDGIAERLLIFKATGNVDCLAELANNTLDDDSAGALGDEVLSQATPAECSAYVATNRLLHVLHHSTAETAAGCRLDKRDLLQATLLLTSPGL